MAQTTTVEPTITTLRARTERRAPAWLRFLARLFRTKPVGGFGLVFVLIASRPLPRL
jgi:hypothetical protein